MLRISEFSDQGVRWRSRDVSRFLILDNSDFVIQSASKTRNLTTQWAVMPMGNPKFGSASHRWVISRPREMKPGPIPIPLLPKINSWTHFAMRSQRIFLMFFWGFVVYYFSPETLAEEHVSASFLRAQWSDAEDVLVHRYTLWRKPSTLRIEKKQFSMAWHGVTSINPPISSINPP